MKFSVISAVFGLLLAQQAAAAFTPQHTPLARTHCQRNDNGRRFVMAAVDMDMLSILEG